MKCKEWQATGNKRQAHGMSHTRTHWAWVNMRERCYNKNIPGFKDYGDRGIKVCERWLYNFKNFHEDMGKAPEGMQLDRIDNDGDYCKENCRWATKTEQMNNRRNNIVLEFNGKKQTLAQWAEEIGVTYHFLHHRIKISHWPIERALTTPCMERGSWSKKSFNNLR